MILSTTVWNTLSVVQNLTCTQKHSSAGWFPSVRCIFTFDMIGEGWKKLNQDKYKYQMIRQTSYTASVLINDARSPRGVLIRKIISLMAWDDLSLFLCQMGSLYISVCVRRTSSISWKLEQKPITLRSLHEHLEYSRNISIESTFLFEINEINSNKIRSTINYFLLKKTTRGESDELSELVGKF